MANIYKMTPEEQRARALAARLIEVGFIPGDPSYEDVFIENFVDNDFGDDPWDDDAVDVNMTHVQNQEDALLEEERQRIRNKYPPKRLRKREREGR